MRPMKWTPVVAAGLFVATSSGAFAQPTPTRLTDQQVSARVEGLLAQMTLEEKVGQLTQIAGGLFPGVTFPLGPDELRYWSTSQRKWVQEAEAFNVWVGADSTAKLHTDLTVVP